MYRNLLILAILFSGPGCIAGAQTPAAPASTPVRILVLEMTVEGEAHRINRARVLDSGLPLKAAHATASKAIQYELTDTSEHLLVLGSIDDPRILRGVFPPAGEPQTGHPVVVLESADYVLRVPYSSSARFLKLSTQTGVNSVGAGAEKTAVQSQTLDLAPYLEGTK